MLLKLNSLTESLEKKYTLNENSSPYMVEFLYDNYDDRTDICDENLRGHLKVEADSPEQAIEAAKQYCRHYGYHNGSNFGFFKISDDNYTNVKVINAHELLGESLTESAKLNEKFDDSSIEKYDDYKERCADCFALVEVDNQWFCDEAQNFCELVECCPEGMGCLIESLSLNEKFSDSMPKWLKDRLGFTNAYNTAIHPVPGSGHNKGNRYDRVNKVVNTKYPNQTDNPTASRPRGFYGHESSLSLGPQFLEAGIDLNKVEVTEAPVPTKVPRQTKHQQIIPIFAFKNGQVWAKGINDREEVGANCIPGYTGDTFKKVPGSEIIDNAVAYAYIDLSAKGATDTLKQARANLKKELESISDIARGTPGTPGRDSAGHQTVRDKSGYLRTNAARYREIAKELAQKKKYKQLPALIADIEDKLIYYKQQLTMLLDEIDFSDVDGSSALMSDLADEVNRLKYATREFGNVKYDLDQINDLDKISSSDEYYANKALRDTEDCYDHLELVELNIGHLFKEVADW